MSPFRLVLLSIGHFWKMNVATGCGVAVGTAVLTGRCSWVTPCAAACVTSSWPD